MELAQQFEDRIEYETKRLLARMYADTILY